MKKQLHFHYPKLLLLYLSASLFFLGCQKDDTSIYVEQSSKETKINFLSESELPVSILGFLSTKSKIFSKRNDKSGKGTATVDLENIMQVIDTVGNTNYTFRLKVPHSDETVFYNLIVRENTEDSTSSSYVLKYQLDKSHLQTWKDNNKDFTYFTGKVYRYNLSNFFNSYGTDSTSGKKSFTPPDSCPCDVDDVDNGGGSPGGGGSSTGGTGGSGGVLTPSLQCTTTYTTTQIECCDEGYCYSHYPSKGGGYDGYCSGTYITTAKTECRTVYTTKSSIKKTMDDCLNPCEDDPSDGEVGVLLPRPLSSSEISDRLGFKSGLEYNWLAENTIERFRISEFLTANPGNDAVEESVKKTVQVLSGSQNLDILTTVEEHTIFNQIIGNVLTGLNSKIFPEHSQAFTDIDPLNLLSPADWALISQKSLEIYRIVPSYVISSLLDFEELSLAHQRLIAKNSAFIGFLPNVKSIVGEYWPQTQEQWSAIGAIMGQSLLEIGLAVIPGSDIIGVVQGIDEGDYVAVSFGIAGLIADAFGGTIIKAVAKVGKVAYKTFKIFRIAFNFVETLAKSIRKGFKAILDGDNLKLFNKSDELIAKGDEVGDVVVDLTRKVSNDVTSKLTTTLSSTVKKNLDDALDSGEVIAEIVEDSVEEIVEATAKKGSKLSWPEVKALFKRGNDFNKKAVTNEWYDYHEVHLANGKRLDSYDPIVGEIVSRKATDLGNIKFSTFENYLKEMRQKYSAGTNIKSRKYQREFAELGITKIEGQQILEIPASNQSLTNIQTFIDFARNNYNITIRFRPE